MATRRELVEAIQKRYQHARLAKKTAILDEFIVVTGYHRKHAVRLLGSNGERRDKKLRSKERIYGDAVQEALILLWEAADRICGKRLKALARCCSDPWRNTATCSWRPVCGIYCCR